MIINEFPPEYRQTLDIRTNQQVEAARNKSREEKKKIFENNKKSEPQSDSYTVPLAIIGFILGFFPCLSTCTSSSYEAGSMIGSFIGSIAIWVGCAGLGVLIGKIIYSRKKDSFDTTNEKIADMQREEEANTEDIVRIIQKQAEEEYMEYCRQFDTKAQEESVKYADSDLAVRVIEWISDGFIKTIEAADRRSHIERIIVPFIFNVYYDKITCNLGVFDFEIERCSNLASPIDQTALARAIAASVHLNISLKFPNDPSGTDIIVNTDYVYHNNYVETTMSYEAINGNYTDVKNWK